MYDEFYYSHRAAKLWTAAYRITGDRSDSDSAVDGAWDRFRDMDDESRGRIPALDYLLAAEMARKCRGSVAGAAKDSGWPPEGVEIRWLPDPILGTLPRPVVGKSEPVVSWLPEAMVDALDEPRGRATIKRKVVRDEGVRMAAMVAQHDLPLAERVAFVLVDVCELPCTEVAGVLGCSPAMAEQYVSTARRRLAEADPLPRVKLSEQHRILQSFMSTARTGDVRAVAAKLDPDVVIVRHSDVVREPRPGGGLSPYEHPAPASGVDSAAGFSLGLAAVYDPEALIAAGPVFVNDDGGYLATGLSLVNGDLGLVAPGRAGGHRSEVTNVGRVTTFAFRDGRIAAIYDTTAGNNLYSVLR
ncbi:MAG: sigma factor-like helix-turn-helix DNA-binding protein [Actinoallomurus sp.]